jgi:putative transposase
MKAEIVARAEDAGCFPNPRSPENPLVLLAARTKVSGRTPQVSASGPVSAPVLVAVAAPQAADTSGAAGGASRRVRELRQEDFNGIAPAVVRWADARAELCLQYRSYAGAVTGAQALKLASFVDGYNAGAMLVSDETRALLPALAVPTFLRWFKRWSKDGVAGLIPGYGKRRGQGLIETTPAIRDHILAAIAHQPHVRATRVHEGLRVRFTRVPSLRRVSAFIATWKREHPALYMRLRDPDDYKRKFSVALGNAAAKVTRVNQLWEIDGSPADAYCTDGLFHLNTVIDVFSRRMVALLTPTASAASTAALLRKTLPVMGIPDEIKSDWGKEYLNARIERAASRIGITWRKVARPYAGELKPFIERNQGTILHNFFEQCPGFKGHSTRQMSEIRAQRSFQQRRGARRNLQRIYDIQLSSAELQELLDRWLVSVYGERAHAGLRGRTPNQVFGEAAAAGQVRRVAEERVLDLWLAEDGVATIGAKGLRVSSTLFWADELIAWRGRKVQFVRTADAGQLLVYSEDGREFIAVATNYEAAGIDRQVVALAAKTREKDEMRVALEELRRAKRTHRPERLLTEIIASAEAQLASALPADASKISALPYRSDASRAADATLAALDAAAQPRPVLTEHADRRALDAAYEEIVASEQHAFYDESLDADVAVARYLTLRETPRADWSAEDTDFMELAPGLPEIQALGRRAFARGA